MKIRQDCEESAITRSRRARRETFADLASPSRGDDKNEALSGHSRGITSHDFLSSCATRGVDVIASPASPVYNPYRSLGINRHPAIRRTVMPLPRRLLALVTTPLFMLPLLSCGSEHSADEFYVLVSANIQVPYWKAAGAGFSQ